MKSVVFLLMILGPLEGSAGGWNQCNVASLTGHCKLFEDLKAADQVVTTDGFTMPACALISVRLKNARKYDEEVKQHAARMTELLNASEKGPVHPVAAADLINRRVLFDFYLKQEGTLELPLPLQASPDKQVKKIISRNEFERELESALGADTSKKLLSEFRRHLLAYYHPASELAHEPEFVIDQKAIDRRSRIFEQAKQGALNFLKAGRPSESLSVAEREMIARISAAKLAPMQGGKVKCGELGGASYKTDPNEVNISEANLFYPDQSVFFSVLHELAHSIDFCRADVKKSGWSPITSADHPFREIGTCLLKERKSGAFVTDQKESKMTSCGHRHQEGFCDWFATEVLAKSSTAGTFHQPSAPLKPVIPADPERTVSFGKGLENVFWSIDLGCGEVSPSSTHPIGHARADEILLLKPEIRSLVGCDPISSDPGCRLSQPRQNSASPSGAATVQ